MKKLDLAIPAAVLGLMVIMSSCIFSAGDSKCVSVTPLLHKLNDLVTGFRTKR